LSLVDFYVAAAQIVPVGVTVGVKQGALEVGTGRGAWKWRRRNEDRKVISAGSRLSVVLDDDLVAVS